MKRVAGTNNHSLSVDEIAEQNYVQLVWMLRQTQGTFALLLVRSNYSTSARQALLERLVGDVVNIPLRVVEMSREAWNAAELIADVAADLPAQGAIVLLGLEKTPEIVPAGGEDHRRPPALALLNSEREAIRSRSPHPLVIWCDPLTYYAIKEHAPDFFDYFTGLFLFEQPKTVHTERQPDVPAHTSDEPEANLVSATCATVTFYEGRVVEHQEKTPERARALLGLAEALLSQRDRRVLARLERAEHAVTEALAILVRHEAPADWARGHLLLGMILSVNPQQERDDQLRKAVDHFTAALQEFTEVKFPLEWARTQNNLGIAYANLSGGDRADHLSRAIDCFTAASRVWTEAEFPDKWAKTQHNLGSTYTNLTTGNRAENLTHAIGFYEAALRVYTESTFPSDWAMTQNNLGATYASFPNGDRDENLRRAIACYEAALRVFTEIDFPDHWAMSQNNLGFAFYKLFSGNREQNLRQAISHYEAALRVYSAAEFPYERATTQLNLESAQLAIGTLQPVHV